MNLSGLASQDDWWKESFPHKRWAATKLIIITAIMKTHCAICSRLCLLALLNTHFVYWFLAEGHHPRKKDVGAFGTAPGGVLASTPPWGPLKTASSLVNNFSINMGYVGCSWQTSSRQRRTVRRSARDGQGFCKR